MDLLSRDDFNTLIRKPVGLSISLYMPTYRAGPQAQQNPIRFKNLLRAARTQLLATGMAEVSADAYLSPARELLADTVFWQHQSDGLALFRAAGLFHYYRLPLAFSEEVVVGERFQIKPLLPLLTDHQGFYILAISQQAVRLLQATHFTVSEIPLPSEVPGSLAAALAYDEFERQAQFYTSASGRHDAPGAVFYGQGTGDEVAKDELLRYLQQIDRGLQPLFQQVHDPLVLAGVDYVQALYRTVNSYPHLLDAGIDGNPDDKRAQDLHMAGWSVVQPLFQRAQQTRVDQYRELAGTGLTSTALEEIVLAAHQGRIAHLFVPRDRQQWGRYDPTTNQVALHPAQQDGDEDLLDLAAMQTLSMGGEVYCVPSEQIPDAAPFVAVFRY